MYSIVVGKNIFSTPWKHWQVCSGHLWATGTEAPGLHGDRTSRAPWEQRLHDPMGTEAAGPCPLSPAHHELLPFLHIPSHPWDSSSLLLSEEHILLFKWKDLESALHRAMRYKIPEPIMMGIPPRNGSAASGTAAAAETSRLSVATLCWEGLGVMRAAASWEPQQWMVTFSNNNF